MTRKRKIGIDFDKVFVSYPPFIPSVVIDFLYKDRSDVLSYRIPGPIEKQLRILSHHRLLRTPIKGNIAAIEDISKKLNTDMYIVSSRFSFLKRRTEDWNKRHNMKKFFKKMYFNFNDEQPHEFKERILRSEKIDTFVDDDLDLLIYLSKRNPKINFYWLDKTGGKKLPKNIKQVTDLSDFLKKYV